jgi:hypothetical protein
LGLDTGYQPLISNLQALTLSDLLTTIQIACVLLLAIGGPTYAVLQLYWRMQTAERDLRNERLRRSLLEREVKQLAEDLAEARRGATKAVAEAADISPHPPDAGTAGIERPEDALEARLAPACMKQIDHMNHFETSRFSGGLSHRRQI